MTDDLELFTELTASEAEVFLEGEDATLRRVSDRRVDIVLDDGSVLVIHATPAGILSFHRRRT